jgi:serine/threonine protein kinase
MQFACPICSVSVSLSDSQPTISCSAPFDAAQDSTQPEPVRATIFHDLFPGFDILNELGRGGMGIVYRAFDRTHNEIVALKTIKGLDASAIAHLKQEFRTLADISHPNLSAAFFVLL